MKFKKKVPFTTGFSIFAECPRHLANPLKHSAKPLQSDALGKAELENNSYSVNYVCRVPFIGALGKHFASA